MTLWQAVLLGIIQGLTEFLPISSTAHLRIVPALLGWDDPGAAFSAVIQIGTLLAVLIYFWRDIVRIVSAVVRRQPEAKLGWMMVLGTIPIVICGLLFETQIKTSLRSLYVISAALIGLAIILWIAEKIGARLRSMEQLGWFDAIVIGLAQATALIPGSSRSGVTITGGLFLGMTRETAARFSFLLSLPSVFAAGVFELVEQREALLSSRSDVANLVAGTIVSAIVGYLAIAFLLRYLKTHSTLLFIVYRLGLGALLLGLLWSGQLKAL